MDALTYAFGQLDDNLRRAFGNTGDSTLRLLNHKKGGNGYETRALVPSGWRLEPGAIDDNATLTVSESDEVPGRDILECAAFAVDDKVWKKIGKEHAAPAGDGVRQWRFKVEPTKETHPFGL